VAGRWGSERRQGRRGRPGGARGCAQAAPVGQAHWSLSCRPPPRPRLQGRLLRRRRRRLRRRRRRRRRRGGGGGGAWCGRRSAGRRRRAETAQRRQRLAANSGTRGRVDAPAACRWRRPAAASRPRRTATTPHWQGPAFESVRRPGRATARRARVANAAADGTHYRARALPGVTMTETGGGCPVRAGGGTARQRGCGGGGGGKGGLPPPPMPRDGLTVRL